MAKILLGISGGIAAYKGPELVRALVKRGHEVQVVLTEAATAFVSELSLSTVSKRAVRRSLFDPAEEAGAVGVGHIQLADAADVVVIAPATADLMARMAVGMANDLLTTILLATRAPILLAPAMNTHMWRHSATRHNVRILHDRGCRFVGPDRGDLACGFIGEGRMLDPELVADAVMNLLRDAPRHEPTPTEYSGIDPEEATAAVPVDQPSHERPEVELVLTGPRRIDENDALDESLPEPKGQPWTGRHVVVTAGPTRAYINPVRFISNASTGAMGFALAEVARSLGARVTLIAGPVERPTPQGIRRIDVETGAEMLEALDVELSTAGVDLVAMVAAVADLVPNEPAKQKLEKNTIVESLGSMQWRTEVDVLATAVKRHGKQVRFLGFAAETVDAEDPAQIETSLLAAGKKKLASKGTDALFVNRVGVQGHGFASSTNAGYLLVSRDDGAPAEALASGQPMAKARLALWILEQLDRAYFSAPRARHA